VVSGGVFLPVLVGATLIMDDKFSSGVDLGDVGSGTDP
jgi:hypothetical protein